jgi:ribosomal protein S6--L-glutamate ligase
MAQHAEPHLLFVYNNAPEQHETIVAPIEQALTAAFDGKVTAAHLSDVEVGIDTDISVRVAGQPIHATHAHVRIFASEYGLLVTETLKAAGVRVANDPSAVRVADSKFTTALLLAAADVPVPEQLLATSTRDRIVGATAGDWPRVFKADRGFGGTGVHLADGAESAALLLDNERGAPMVNQHFVTESAGHDLRVLVIAGTIIAAVTRRSAHGDFRATIDMLLEPAALSRAETDVALRSAAALGLTVAGVDILRTSTGPVVTEVNASPGLATMARVHGVDIYPAIAEALIAAF